MSAPAAFADDAPAGAPGSATAIEQQAIDALRQRLHGRFPGGRAYTLADLRDPALPAPIARFVAQALHRRLVIEREALREARSAWFDHDAPAVDAAWDDLFDALEQHARVPEAEWPRALDQATGQVASYLLRPAPTLAAFVFADGAPDLPVGVILRRMAYFTSYPYLRDVVAAYVEQRGLDRLDRDTFAGLLARVERRTPTAYRGQWTTLLADLYATLGEGQPAALTGRLLAPALADRGLADLAARLSAYDGLLTLDDLARLIDAEPMPVPARMARMADTAPVAPPPPPASGTAAPLAMTAPADAAGTGARAEPEATPSEPFPAPAAASEAASEAPAESDSEPSAWEAPTPEEAGDVGGLAPAPDARPSPGTDATAPDPNAPSGGYGIPADAAETSTGAGPIYPNAPPLYDAAHDIAAPMPAGEMGDRAGERAGQHAGDPTDAPWTSVAANAAPADLPVWAQTHAAPEVYPAAYDAGIAHPGASHPGADEPLPLAARVPPSPDAGDVPAYAAASESPAPVWGAPPVGPARDAPPLADAAQLDDEDEGRPLWQRFLRRDRPGPGDAGSGAEGADTLDALEARALGMGAAAQRPAFVAALFGGDPGAYAEALRRLDAAATWSDAAAVLLDTFRRQGVDLYDATAVAFTDAAEQRHLR